MTGKIVRFGRGMIESISAEVFKEFRVRLAEKLLQEVTGRAAQKEGSSAQAEDDAALSLLPLLLRALGAWIRRVLGRS